MQNQSNEKKNAILLYGYTFSNVLESDPLNCLSPLLQFLLSYNNINQYFINSKYDIIVHCWSDEYYINDYFQLIQPKYVFIGEQRQVKRIENVLDNITSRVSIFNKFYEILKSESYDMIMLRRFDLIFKKDVDFNTLDKSKIHLIYDSKPNGEPITQEDEDGYFTERLNDYQLTCSHENMLKFLDFNIEDIPAYLAQANTPRKDMHAIVAQRLRHIGLYDKINYFLENPYDVVITKWYNYSKDLKRETECVS